MELPPGVQIELPAGIEGNRPQALFGPAAQLTAAVGDEYRRVTQFTKTRDEELDLMLPAPPRPRRVEMDRRHRNAHNFANFKNT